MHKIFFHVPIICLLSGVLIHIYAADGDTLKWISPTSYSVITTNTIRLCIEPGSIWKNMPLDVEFFVSYGNRKGTSTDTLSIGKIHGYPYELIWDCSLIPDEDFDRIGFLAQITDSKGLSIMSSSLNHIILDRNTSYRTATLSSRYTKHKIVIDGNFLDWAAADSMKFINNENLIIVSSLWDKNNLYFAVKVKDRSLISHFIQGDTVLDRREGNKDYSMWAEDDIEFFFDPMHNRRPMRDTSHKQYLFSPAGLCFESNRDSSKTTSNYNPSLQWAVRTYGTLNNESDQDTGWVIECAIPWKTLGIKPAKDYTLGFDVFNCDRDFSEGGFFFVALSGVEASNLHNPSEWINLILKKDDSFFLFLALGLGIIILGGIGFFYFTRRKKKEEIPSDIPQEKIPLKEDAIFQTALSYIQEHFKEDINLEEIVKATGTNTSTFSKIIKEKTGQTFINYLTQIRIEKSKELLKNTELSIKEISSEVGFNSISYFGAAFKKKENMSPIEYRNLIHNTR